MSNENDAGTSRGSKRASPARKNNDFELGNSDLRNLSQRRHDTEEKLEKHLREQEAAHPKHPQHDGHPVLPERDAPVDQK